jgi:undecaprenyl diphosphate synthase
MLNKDAPRHVAIIMDGNGRWAQAHGHHRIFGHVKGARVAREIIRSSGALGIKYLTLFTFSTENWKRPLTEVTALMHLLEKYLKREQRSLMKDNVRFRFIGDVSKLPISAQKILDETVAMTRENMGLNLIFALNYGGRQEIAAAAKNICKKVLEGTAEISAIDDTFLQAHLGSSFLPDPELVIRTSGEMRVSNFMLWQMAYSEFYFTDTYWPDFTEEELKKALSSFSLRERRYGALPKAPDVSP